MKEISSEQNFIKDRRRCDMYLINDINTK
jgi:hypothetical protein